MERTQTVEKTVVTDSTKNEMNSANQYQTKKVIFRTYQIIWYLLGIVEVLLAVRIGLKFLGGSSSSGFTQFIYAMSDMLAMPFAGIVRTSTYSTSIFEWSSLIAMVVYAIVAYGIVAAIQFFKPTNQEEVELAIDKQ